MSNEFVARKGLVSLRSSSFEETIRVSGSIYSPAEAFLTSSWAVHALTASYINPITSGGSTASLPNTLALRDNNGGTGFKHLLFDTAGTAQVPQTGQVDWNTFEGTLNVHTDISDVVIQVGQEMLVKARNNTGATIPNGSPVFISGSIGNRPTMVLAIANAPTSVNNLIGLVTAEVLDNADSYITVAGKVNGLNTVGYAEGTDLYLSDTVAGGLTPIAPTGSSFPVKVGKVTRSHPTLGSVLVTVRQDFHTSAERLSLSELAAGRVTASLYGTSSYSITASLAINAISSSYALSASYATSASFATTASYVRGENVDIFSTSKTGTGAGGLLLSTHFLSATTALIKDFATTVSGTGAAGSLVAGDIGYPGIVQLSTGTTTTGRASLNTLINAIRFGNGTYTLETMMKLPTSSDPTNRYTLYIGFGDNTGAGDMVDGAYFQYNDSNGNNWQIKAASNSTRTTTTTSTGIVGNTWTKLKVVVADVQMAYFYVNDTLVGSINNNVPQGSGRETGIIFKIEKSAGTTARTVLLDYCKVTYD
jgi:hypothetical protein